MRLIVCLAPPIEAVTPAIPLVVESNSIASPKEAKVSLTSPFVAVIVNSTEPKR